MIDYAGLFPPAGLTMEATVANYDTYRRGNDRDLLGRLIVPVDRIAGFSDAARRLLPTDIAANPWPLSVIVSGDLAEARREVLEFNCSHWRGSERGHASIDSVEIAVGTDTELDVATAAFPKSIEVFIEVAADPSPERLIKSIANAGVHAKVRTGGVSPEKFPSAPALARFIAACHRHGVKFKATAGLHHPLMGRYPLTYESGSEMSVMFGYLNLLVATAFIYAGLSEEVAAGVLSEDDVLMLDFDDTGVAWRGEHASSSAIRAAREQLALSFGSCSFDEPVADARHLGLL